MKHLISILLITVFIPLTAPAAPGQPKDAELVMRHVQKAEFYFSQRDFSRALKYLDLAESKIVGRNRKSLGKAFAPTLRELRAKVLSQMDSSAPAAEVDSFAISQCSDGSCGPDPRQIPSGDSCDGTLSRSAGYDDTSVNTPHGNLNGW